MASLLAKRHLWWKPARKIGEREGERKVTFLELFYDLVYVVLIAEIAHHLAHHVNARGIGESVLLFVLVWLAWLNGTMYHDLHGNHDIRTRVFTFLQMGTVAGMAVFAHNAFGEGSVGFALCFAAYQLILTNMWWHTGTADPAHRPLSVPYSLAFLASAILFGVSAFVPEPWRYLMWLIGLVLSIAVLMLPMVMRPKDPKLVEQLKQAMDISPSAVERFGLFMIIVLGEVIVGVVRGLAGHHHLDWTVGMTGGLGILVAIGLWWLYFDFVSRRQPVASSGKVAAWCFLHLFTTMGIAAAGAAMLNVIEHAGHGVPASARILLVMTVAMAMVSIALLMRTTRHAAEHARLYRTATLVTLVVACAVLVLGFVDLPAIAALAVLVALLLVPAYFSIRVWVHHFGGEHIEFE